MPAPATWPGMTNWVLSLPMRVRLTTTCFATAGKSRSLKSRPRFTRTATPSAPVQTLVAVTSDGTIHVFDGSHLALASYAPDGTLLRAIFLPEPQRSEALQRNARDVKSFGGPQVALGAWLATSLQPLADGRLFVDINMGDAMGYVLDPATTEATLVVASGAGRRRPSLDGLGGDATRGTGARLRAARQLRAHACGRVGAPVSLDAGHPALLALAPSASHVTHYHMKPVPYPSTKPGQLQVTSGPPSVQPSSDQHAE